MTDGEKVSEGETTAGPKVLIRMKRLADRYTDAVDADWMVDEERLSLGGSNQHLFDQQLRTDFLS